MPHMQHVGPESRRSSLHVRHQPPTNPSFLRVCVGSSERNAPIPHRKRWDNMAAGTQALSALCEAHGSMRAAMRPSHAQLPWRVLGKERPVTVQMRGCPSLDRWLLQ